MSLGTLLETDLKDVELAWKGKVRDVYSVDDQLVIITTDRISAFDVVLPNGIPDKGRVLNQTSLYWFQKTGDLVPNHLVSASVDEYPGTLRPYASQLEGRSMLVKRLAPVAFECVIRGYLYGSGWKEYQREGSVCGIALPKGMRLAERFDEPLFTPSTKATEGHDENVSEEYMTDALGAELTSRLRDISLELYTRGRDEAAGKGIIIADTKFEFGLDEAGTLYLIDEVLTPDSSRFWPAESYAPGKDQPSYDKQFVREYLETLDWDKNPPGPELPDSVVAGTQQRYRQAFETLTGGSLK